MKKSTVVMIVLLSCSLAAGLYWGARWVRARLAPQGAELRVRQVDEDAAPAPEPAVSVLVNGQAETTVARGGPVVVTVAATHRHAVNVASKLALLRARSERLAGQGQRSGRDEQALQRTLAAVAALEAAGRLTLGGAARPWTEAVQVTLRSPAGGQAAPWALRRLASRASGGAAKAAAAVAVLDAESSAEVHLTPDPAYWTELAAGQYEVRACLEASGDWRGTACSEPARMTLVESEAGLTEAGREAVDREAARLALLAQDWTELERRGKALLARDRLAGHTALGDAYFGQQNWERALAEYTAALAARPRKNGNVPRVLNIRISRLLRMLDAE